MIRRSDSPRRLGRLGLLAVCAAALAALPLAPTLAQPEPGDVAANAENREVVVTPAEPKVVQEYDVETRSADNLAYSPDGKIVTVEKDGDVVQLDARTGKILAKTRVADPTGKGGGGAAEVEQARAEVAKLSAALAEAKDRLKKLESRAKLSADDQKKMYYRSVIEAKPKEAKGVDTKNWDTRGWEAKGWDKAWADKNNSDFAPKKDAKGSSFVPKALNADDRDARLEKLEQKLDKLDRLLEDLRDARGKDDAKRSSAEQRPL